MRYFFVFLSFLFTLPLLSQDSLSLLQLPEISVSDNRLSIPLRENVHTVIVIPTQKIQAFPAHSTAELIQHFAGVDVRQRGVHGVQSDISLRGSSYDQVLILLDGIPMIDPQTGHHSLNLPISKESIQRIEILKGPAARIYGPNAFAGAINIVTKTKYKHRLTAKIEAGDFGLWSGQISASLPKTNTSLSMSTAQSAGYKPNTDYQLLNGFLRQNWSIHQTAWKLIGGITGRKFGANGFYASPQFKDQYEEIQTSFVALQMTAKSGKWLISPRVFWRRNQDDYVFKRQNPEYYHNTHISHTLGAEVNLNHKSNNFTTGIGLSANRFNLTSNNLGRHQRNSLGLFLEERVQLFDNQLDIIPGLNLHYYSDFGIKLFPGLDVGWTLNDHWKLYTNAGYTWRAPSYTDLYYVGRTNIGNPNLQPETAFTAELGTKYNSQNWTATMALFRRMGDNIIDWTKSADTALWQPNNYNQVLVTGLELDINYQLHRLNVGVNYTYIQSELAFTEALFSRYALNNLRHQFNTNATFQIADKGQLTINYRYLDRVTLPSYHLVDAKASWSWTRFSIFAQASNILNQQYTETNLVEMPGRWVSGGIRFRIK